jgi:hypothetical protein
VYWPRYQYPQIDNCKVIGRYHTVGRIFLPPNQSQRFEQEKEKFAQQIQVLLSKLRLAAFEQICVRVVLGQTMSWTRNEVEELWHRVEKVDDLWDEEQ